MISTSRAAEYFTVEELQAQTGQPASRFPEVVLKELLDNALDACETAGVAPEIDVADRLRPGAGGAADRGPGQWPRPAPGDAGEDPRLPDPHQRQGGLPLAHPRGQGNALKTVIGIPHALGATEPMRVAACGVRHTIRAAIDPAGELRLDTTGGGGDGAGHPGRRARSGPAWARSPSAGWARAFALFNPHATVRMHPPAASAEGAGLPPNPGDAARGRRFTALWWATPQPRDRGTGGSGRRPTPRPPGGTAAPSSAGWSSPTSGWPATAGRTSPCASSSGSSGGCPPPPS